MVERNDTHTCMYNCKSYCAREVSSVPSRSKEHDTTVFVCDYIVHADVCDKMDLGSVFGIQQASPVCPFPRPVSLPVLAPVHTVMASEPPLSLLRTGHTGGGLRVGRGERSAPGLVTSPAGAAVESAADSVVRGRSGALVGWDACEVRLCDPCARVCPGSPRCLFTGHPIFDSQFTANV
jgi:hypothetical protein